MNFPELHESNQARTRLAAERTVAESCVALDVINCHEPVNNRDHDAAFIHWHALKARHDNPQASLAEIAAGLDDPYLRRWYVIPRNPWLNVYVHQFLRSDDDRALHDHPWWFVSLMLRGRYAEITDQGTRWRRAGSVAFRPATWRHRVQLDSNSWVSDREFPCWTLIVTGRRSRTWGFWCQHWDTTAPLTGLALSPPDPVERFVPWDEFDDAGCGEH